MVLSTLILVSLFGPACTPAASDHSPRSPTARPTHPPRPRITMLPRVLPIPLDHGVVRLNLAQLWTSAIYRKYRTRILSYISGKMKAIPGGSVFATRCGFDMERDLLAVAFAVDTRPGNKPKIAVVRIRIDANRLLRCFAKIVGPQSTFKSLGFGPLQGIARYKAGILQDEILILDSHRLVWMGPRSRLAVRQVLTGERQSVTSTQLYRAVRSSQPVAPMVLAVLPTVHRIPSSNTLPLMKDMMAGGLAFDLPQGGLKLRGLIAFDKKETATMLMGMKSMVARILNKKFPALTPMVRKLRMTPDPSDPAVILLNLALTAAELTPLIAMLENTLSTLTKKSPPARP